MLASNICEFLVRKLLRVTLPEARMLRLFLEFFKIGTTLRYYYYYYYYYHHHHYYYLLTYLLTHSLTYVLTHSLTYSLTYNTYLLMQLSCHSLAVVLTIVETKQMGINIRKRNNAKTQYKKYKTQ